MVLVAAWRWILNPRMYGTARPQLGHAPTLHRAPYATL